jgi:hypothetical protein
LPHRVVFDSGLLQRLQQLGIEALRVFDLLGVAQFGEFDQGGVGDGGGALA